MHRETFLNCDDYSQRAVAEDPADVEPDAAGPDAGGGAAPIEVDAGEGAGDRLDRFLARALAGRVEAASRSRVQRWIALGAVWCDERELAADTRLLGHERIHVQPLPREADRAFEPDPVPLAIVHEDEHLIVIDKPAGLVMHPAAGNWRGTLLNGLLHHRREQAALPRAGIVHRLDKDTSGLVVVARSEAALASLAGQLARRTVSRRYLAVVAGDAPESGTVDAPVGRDPRTRTRMAVVEPPAGRDARTHFARIAHFRVGGVAASLVECRLETGRTHQIRVHMREIGHPLVGDVLYGGPGAGFGRQALHAWRLAFAHPVGGSQVRWVSVPPADMRDLLAGAGVDVAGVCADLDRRIGR